jgi:hypothetical protein
MERHGHRIRHASAPYQFPYFVDNIDDFFHEDQYFGIDLRLIIFDLEYYQPNTVARTVARRPLGADFWAAPHPAGRCRQAQEVNAMGVLRGLIAHETTRAPSVSVRLSA